MNEQVSSEVPRGNQRQHKPRGSVNSLLASCETILAEGRKPTRQMHDGIVDLLRGGSEATWEAFPLTQTWFTQLP